MKRDNDEIGPFSQQKPRLDCPALSMWTPAGKPRAERPERRTLRLQGKYPNQRGTTR